VTRDPLGPSRGAFWAAVIAFVIYLAAYIVAAVIWWLWR
jgi:hypothetical protein